MPKRTRISKGTEALVMIRSRRKCCLCVYLDKRDEVRLGQIAHLNRNSSNSEFDNLVFLCLEHHDRYDGKTSQSKGFSELEVRHWRDELYNKLPQPNGISAIEDEVQELAPLPAQSAYSKLINSDEQLQKLFSRSWRYPLWQVANEPEYFAYKVIGGIDGICLIERIDIPDGRIVIVCIQTSGNPGKSITNAVEVICLQVCHRFNIPPEKLVWIEHYQQFGDHEWQLVTFSRLPPNHRFSEPKWTKMTPQMWKGLKLKPRKKLRVWAGGYSSMVTKLFHWPNQNLHGTEIE